jgi:hypothetical protein
MQLIMKKQFVLSTIKSVKVIDSCLTPDDYFQSYIMTRTSFVEMIMIQYAELEFCYEQSYD